MKKITVLFALFVVLAVASCTSKTDATADATAADSTAVAVDTASPVAVDTVAVVDTTAAK